MSDYIQLLRSLIGNQRILTPSTACILRNEHDEILLQHRKDTDNWGCPGGLMEIGETVVQSLFREVKEETGIEIASIDLLGIYSGPSLEGTYPNGDEIASVLMVFISAVGEVEPIKDDESKELRFFSAFALPKNLNDHHEPYLKDYQAWLKGEIVLPVVM